MHLFWSHLKFWQKLSNLERQRVHPKKKTFCKKLQSHLYLSWAQILSSIKTSIWRKNTYSKKIFRSKIPRKIGTDYGILSLKNGWRQIKLHFLTKQKSADYLETLLKCNLTWKLPAIIEKYLLMVSTGNFFGT